MKYAVAISDQGINSPTVVFDFVFKPDVKLHVWKGEFATTPKQLCDQVNEAVAMLDSMGSPFVTLRVVEIEGDWNDTTKAALIQANEELREVIRRLEVRKIAA